MTYLEIARKILESKAAKCCGSLCKECPNSGTQDIFDSCCTSDTKLERLQRWVDAHRVEVVNTRKLVVHCMCKPFSKVTDIELNRVTMGRRSITLLTEGELSVETARYGVLIRGMTCCICGASLGITQAVVLEQTMFCTIKCGCSTGILEVYNVKDS